MQSLPPDLYSAAFYSAYDETVILDEEGFILDANDKWKQFTRDNDGDSSNYYLGENYLQVCSGTVGESGAISSLVLNGVREVLSGADSFRCEYPCHSPTVKRWFELTASPIEAGGKRFALVSHRNITTRHIQIEQTISSGLQKNMLAAIVATSPDAVMSYDLEGNILTWNASATALYGYSSEEIEGRSMEVLYPEGSPDRIGDIRDQILAGKLKNFEVVRKRKDGGLRNIAISCAPVRGEDGEVICISNIHRDITELKASQEHIKLISGELGHRAKNQLAVVRSFSNQTAKHAVNYDEYRQKFDNRIQAMAKSIDLLVSRDWASVSLENLSLSQIVMFTDARPEKVTIAGPEIVLVPAAVEAIGMALHELATNAVKYGALAQEEGHISLTWEISSQADEESLKVNWRESGVNIEQAPVRKGFGHVVLTRLAQSSFGSEADLSFSPQGLVWEIAIPSDYYERP